MYLPLIDLQEMYSRAKTDLDELSNKNLLLTGQTGFFGIWLLSLFSFYVNLGNRSPNLYIVSRRPKSFVTRFPEIVRNLKISWIESDIRDFKMPDVNLDYVLHGASTSAYETFNKVSNLDKFETILEGTRQVLRTAKLHHAKSILYLSSGAIYGNSHRDVPIPETSVIEINHFSPEKTLGLAKLSAETLCNLYQSEVPNLHVKIARCFSFIGPQIPLDLHYAIGNFIRDALRDGEVTLRSDGRISRSYLYMGDTTVWILKALTYSNSSDFPLHIGSKLAISIRELAEMVARECNGRVVETENKQVSNSPASNYYVPSTNNTRNLLKVEEWTNLKESIRRTLLFFSPK